MRAIGCGLVLALSLGCSGAPPPRPPPAVHAAPASVARLRVHVANATSARAREAKEDDVTGFTLNLRSAFQELAGRAGYVVVVDPSAPRDVEARIHSDYQSGPRGDHGSLVVSLTLVAAGGTVDQLAAVVPVLEYADLDLEAVARLVEAMGRSERVRRYAERVQRPDVPCAPTGPQIAAP